MYFCLPYAQSTCPQLTPQRAYAKIHIQAGDGAAQVLVQSTWTIKQYELAVELW